MSTIATAQITSVHHITDRLCSFTTTRDPGLRFRSGQFIMLGLAVDRRPQMRAYSIASASYDDALGFLSIKVPNDTLTCHLQHVRIGDEILLGRKPTGTLLPDLLPPGARLYLFATGSGLAPFLSLIRDPDIYARYEHVTLVHGCRRITELAVRRTNAQERPQHELVGDAVRSQLSYISTVTREPFETQGQIPDLIISGRLAELCGLPPLDPERDRAMLCGSPAMLGDLRQLLESRGFVEGGHNEPGHFVVERAFVERSAVPAPTVAARHDFGDRLPLQPPPAARHSPPASIADAAQPHQAPFVQLVTGHALVVPRLAEGRGTPGRGCVSTGVG